MRYEHNVGGYALTGLNCIEARALSYALGNYIDNKTRLGQARNGYVIAARNMLHEWIGTEVPTDRFPGPAFDRIDISEDYLDSMANTDPDGLS